LSVRVCLTEEQVGM